MSLTESERRILAAVAGLRFPLGRIRVTDVLYGSRSKELLKWGLDEHPQYGALRGAGKKSILAAIDQLVTRGLLAVRGSDKPVLHLTESGRRALAEAAAGSPVAEAPEPQAAPTDAGESVQMRKSARWREHVEMGILECLDELSYAPTARILARTARWRRPHEHGLTMTDLLANIADMTDRGLLELRGDERPVVAMTQAGMELLQRRRQTTPARVPKPRGIPAEASDAEAAAQFLSRSRELPIEAGHLDGGVSLDVNSRFVEGERKYTELGRDVFRYKYDGCTDLVRPLADRLEKAINAHAEFNACEVVVPVPPSQHDRSQQPVVGLAKALEAYHGRRVALEALVKARQTQKQKELETMAGKRENVSDAFRVARPDLIQGRPVLLLDDFVDSGETLNECARALKQAGAKAVYAITLVRTIHHAR